MGKITWSGIGVTNGIGKIGGNTLSHGRNGSTLQKKTHQVNHSSPAQQKIKGQLNDIQLLWRTCTIATHVAYKNACIQFPKKNSLGETHYLHGLSLFTRLNRNLQQLQRPVINTFNPVETIGAISSMSIIPSIAANQIPLQFYPSIPLNDGWIIQATKPMSAGTTQPGKGYKQIGQIFFADLSILQIRTQYEDVYGESWKSIGKKIYFRFRPIGMNNGYESTPFLATAIVTA